MAYILKISFVKRKRRDYNPPGKLTVTFPRNVGQVFIFYAAKNTGRPFDENEKYTSKYLDVPNTPIYPFGYGLSYSNFTYCILLLDKAEYGMNDTIRITVNIKNESDRAGEEVVQLISGIWWVVDKQ